MKHYIITVFAAVIMLSFVSVAMADTGTEIIKKSEETMRGDTQIALYKMTIKTRRWERTMTLRNWDARKGKKGFSEVLSPEKDAGNRFLLLDKTMWHYVPKLQKEYKISPSMMLQSWMGSDFSNDDIVKESSIVEDYTHKLEGKTVMNGEECYKVILHPLPEAAVVWGKIVYYARVKDCLPVKQEYYNEHGILKKMMSFSQFKFMHDRVIPTILKMDTVGKKDSYTILEIQAIKFNVPISPGVFSIQNLTRR